MREERTLWHPGGVQSIAGTGVRWSPPPSLAATGYWLATLRVVLLPNCTSSCYAEKRQGTAALQDASAFFGTLLFPKGLGVRLSSAAFISLISAGNR